MITLTAAAKNALAQDGARIAFDVSVGAPVSKNLTALVKSIPNIRTSVRPMERTPEISSLSVVMDNPDNLLSTWNAAGLIGSKKWNGELVTVKLGVFITPETKELATVFVGDLEDVIDRIPREQVELLCADPFSRLQRNTISGTLQGTEYVNESPTHVIKQLLIEAGYTSRMLTTSFDDAIAEERSEGQRLRSYTIQEGTWMSAISVMLKHANGGLRLDKDGQIELYKYRPTSTASLITLTTERDTGELVVRKPSADIINSYGVLRKDFDGSDVLTVNSPVEDAQSITDFGTIKDGFNTLFATDQPGESIAIERLGSKSQPPVIVEMPASIDHFPIELWDEITVTDRDGFSATGLVFEKIIEPRSVKTSLKMFSTKLNTEPWLFCDNSQDLDDGQLVF